jgi:multiple sugar transport system permease protein
VPERTISVSARGIASRFLYSLLILVLFIAFVLEVFPFIWMILGSFKPVSEVLTISPTFLPRNFTWGNYKEASNVFNIPRCFINSVIVSSGITVLVIFTSSLAGYVFAKFRYPGRNFLFVLVLICLMVPIPVLLIPLFLVVKTFGWVNTYWGLIIPMGANAFGIYLVRQFSLGIPNDYIDAARVDGLKEFLIYLRVILPLLKPVVSALVILNFFVQWDNLLWPLVIAQKPRVWTLPIGIMTTRYALSGGFGAYLASATVAIVPVLIIYVFFQRELKRGITLTGLKG